MKSGGWQPYTIGETITLTNVGDTVQFQDLNPGNYSVSNYRSFAMTGKIAASGNLLSLNNYSTVVTDFGFYSIFGSCSSLTTPPEIPAETIGVQSFHDAFANCSNLKYAPDLPAMNIAVKCYWGMFNRCSRLVTAPSILPALTIFSQCYDGMFRNCTRLTTAPELPATTLAQSCYYTMFYGCTSLTTAPELPAITLESGCYYQMFAGCSSLVNAPELPAKKLAEECYYSMFNGCSSLTTAPELPATTLANYCYHQMFRGCTRLNYIKVGFTEWHSNGTVNWVNAVSSTGTFEAPVELSIQFGTSRIPEGWTITKYKNETTPHNLTSNTSDSRYEISMINTFDNTQVAFRAMDGITDVKDKCSAHSRVGYRNWWQIKFNEGKVKIVQITFVWRPGYPIIDSSGLIVTDFYLQGSDDGVNFYTEAEFSVDVNATTVNKISVNNSYQYWRIIDSTQLNRYLVIGQIQFKYILAMQAYYLSADDQNFIWPLNEYKEKQIECVNFGDELYFEILEGNLPEGIQFDESTGTFSGTSDVEFNENLVIQISNGVNSVIINVGLKCAQLNVVVEDGLTLYMPFTTSVTEPKIGETFVSDSLPVLDVVDGEACTTFNSGQYLYNDSNNYWTVGNSGSNLTMVFDIYKPFLEDVENRCIIVAGIITRSALTTSSLGYAIHQSDIGIIYFGHEFKKYSAFQLNKWTKVIITISSSSSSNVITLYVDGQKISSISRNYPGVMNNYLGLNVYEAGVNSYPAGQLQYSIKELCVYNRVLTDDEITLIFNSNN